MYKQINDNTYLSDLEVVICPKRPSAEFCEVTVKYTTTGLVEVHISALDTDCHLSYSVRLLSCHELEKASHILICFFFRFRFVEEELVSATKVLAPIVNAWIEGDYSALFLQHVKKGKEVTPLDAVLVQVLWRPVRGCHKDDSLVKQVGKQLLQDHGISYVSHLEFVQADNPTLLNNIGQASIVLLSSTVKPQQLYLPQEALDQRVGRCPTWMITI